MITLLLCLSLLTSWQSESLAAIQSRMIVAESTARAMTADSIIRTQTFDQLKIGDTVGYYPLLKMYDEPDPCYNEEQGIVIVKAVDSGRVVHGGNFFWQQPSYERHAGPCIVIQTTRFFVPFSDCGGGWGDPPVAIRVLWRNDDAPRTRLGKMSGGK